MVAVATTAAPWRRRAGCCALLAIAMPAHAQLGEPATVTGSLRLDYFSASRDLEETPNVFAASGEVKIRQPLAAGQRVEVEARASQVDLTRSGEQDFRWLSAYWFFRDGPVALWLGQQKVRWGKADGLNPTDFFTPIDYTVTLPLEADRYRSIPALRADLALDDAATLSLVMEPHFSATRLPWPDSIPVTVVTDEPSGLERPQLGLRLLNSGENLDWSVSGFRGYSTFPVLSFAGVGDGGLPRYDRYYPRSDAFGADVAHNFGPWGFRAEVAYSHYREEGARQPVASGAFLVSGVDRSVNDWNFNLQALYRYTPHPEKTAAADNAGELFAAAQNAVVYNQRDRHVPGMTARVSAEWLHNTLRTELLYVAFFGPDNSLVRPLLTYAISDTQKLLIGGEYYSGPDRSFFGAFKNDRTVFLEFQQFI